MRLEVFNVIDQALDILQNNRDAYIEAAEQLRELFASELNNDYIINIITRIKEPVSLKEKIIRKKLYGRYRSGSAIMEHLSDVVGVRIECRFIKDEIAVYNELKRVFNCLSDGWFYTDNNIGIGLELTSEQPQQQRNGVDIYRIDGIINKNGRTIRFELQIKSLVKVFWAEIEHKIVYKNNSYRLIDDFFQNLMLSINNNLVSIDQQLMLVYEQMQKHDAGESYMQAGATKQILAKAINDMLYNKMNEEMGFTVNFKKPCEVLADFVFNNGVTGADAVKAGSMEVMVMLLYRIKGMKLDMQDSMNLERPLRFGDGFSRIMGEALSKIMNEDFEWNLFFRVLFIMEPNNNSGDLEFFISYIRKELTDKCQCINGEVGVIVLEDLLEHLAEAFATSPDISFISRDNLDKTADMLCRYMRQITAAIDDQNEWIKYKAHFLANTAEYIPT